MRYANFLARSGPLKLSLTDLLHNVIRNVRIFCQRLLYPFKNSPHTIHATQIHYLPGGEGELRRRRTGNKENWEKEHLRHRNRAQLRPEDRWDEGQLRRRTDETKDRCDKGELRLEDNWDWRTLGTEEQLRIRWVENKERWDVGPIFFPVLLFPSSPSSHLTFVSTEPRFQCLKCPFSHFSFFPLLLFPSSPFSQFSFSLNCPFTPVWQLRKRTTGTIPYSLCFGHIGLQVA